MNVETVQMKVSGLMCSFCTMSVEKALKRYPGVQSVMVNLVHGVVLVEADTDKISRDELTLAVEKLGYDVAESEVQQYNTDEALHSLIKRRGAIGMTLAVISVLLDPLNLIGLPAEVRAWISFAIAAVVLLWVGQPILRKTWLAVRQRVINANVLLSTAAWGSFIVGTLSLFDGRWPNFLPVAAWLMALHLFFGYFKLDTRKKASEAVRKLLSLQPPRARVLRGEGIVEVHTNDVAIGETVAVRPGERIPLDGKVIQGAASVDESSFTGESVPATKEMGASVIGGTLNLDGSLKVRVTKVGADSFLSQIVRLMSQIAERKPPIELLADRLMNYYGPVVFVAAVIAFAGWLLVTGNWIAATVVLLTVIIMGYPCALGISTPMLAAIAGGKGISIGLLVKASEVFHELSTIDTIAFDKTGTLTYGRPTVTDVVPLVGVSPSSAGRPGVAEEPPEGGTPTSPGFSRAGSGMEERGRAELLAIAGAVEEPSEHPLAQAISFYAQREGARLAPVENFRAFPGKGVSALLGGQEILAGRPSFVEERGVSLDAGARERIEQLAGEGKTVVAVAHAGPIVGLVALQDTPRRGVEKIVARAKKTRYPDRYAHGRFAPRGRCDSGKTQHR